MSMPPIAMSPASQTRSAQANAVMTAIATMTTARSRRSTASSAVSLMSLLYDAALAEIDVGELRVGIGELDRHRLRYGGPAAPHLGERIFESVRDIDADAILRAGDRILDRLAAALGDAAHDQPALTGVDVDVEVDGGENGFVEFLKRRREHLKDGGAGLGILAAEDAQERPALRLARPLVDHDRRFTFALVNGARPAEDANKTYAVEPGVAVITLVDLHAGHGLAIAV